MSKAIRGCKSLELLLLLSSCTIDDAYVWSLPDGVLPPPEPADNPTTAVKVELGRRLFFDARLSADETYSCASCHEPTRFFTDGLPVSRGLYGDALPRGAPSVANSGYLRVYTWANPRLTSLEEQALVPMLAKRPPELDIADRVPEVMARLEDLRPLFEDSFPEDLDPMVIGNLARAFAAYQRTLISADAPYDRRELDDRALRGEALFTGLGCAGCHSGRWFTDAAESDHPFHNTGLYDLGGTGAYPFGNHGLHEFTGVAEDMGKFRTPSLRNVAETAPYMHDGSIATLNEVIDHYAAGGRTANRYKDPRLTGFSLGDSEREDLVAFLESLTDSSFALRGAAE
jgi:cytochrome c peroxidase